MKRTTASQIAAQVSDALDDLDRTLSAADGWPGLDAVGDVYSVVGSLGTGVERLPQTCDQLAAYVTRRQGAGVLRHDGGGDVGERVAVACAELAEAAALADRLVAGFERVQRALAVVGEVWGP